MPARRRRTEKSARRASSCNKYAIAGGEIIIKMPSVEDEVRVFISDNLLFGEDVKFSDEDSFLEEGIIDSTGILELIHFLEERYGFYVEDDELVPENLDSVSRLVKYVRRKCGIARESSSHW